MYAIIETGGKQYRVSPGDTIAVERLAGFPGESLDLERVLLLGGDGGQPRIGDPGVAGALVRAEVVTQHRGKKLIIFRYKSKVRYRRKTGHRQELTQLRITDILMDGTSLASAPAAVSAHGEVMLPAEPLAEPMPAPETGAPPAAQIDMPPAAGEAGPPPAESV
jgi:large subunit ribosomal protein L21